MGVKRKILVQLDSDAHASVFDRVVAVDGGAEEVFSYGGVSPEQVRDLVYGCIFTRGPKDLKHTAVFIGGSNVTVGEEMLAIARKSFLGPLQVSLMLDANGANTTAAGAVLAAGRHVNLSKCSALVLGGTGPVGQRAAQMLASEGARVRVGSRQKKRAGQVCEKIMGLVGDGASLEPVAAGTPEQVADALEGVQLVISAGAIGVTLLTGASRKASKTLEAVIDLNAVPPAGIEGLDPMAAGVDLDGVVGYGAIGVGNIKMKIHKAAIGRLFESNDAVLDAAEVYAIGKGL
jgi:hypothetical protein